MAKGFVQNTVKGKQQGKAYPEAMKTTCLLELLTNDIHFVAQKHSIPESTLRNWQKKAQEKSGDAWAQARAEAIRSVSTMAAAGAHKAVQQAVEALEINEITRKKRAELVNALMDKTLPPEARDAIKELLEIIEPISDGAMIGYIKALTYATEKAGLMMGEGTAPVVEVVIKGAANEYAE